MRYFRYGLSLHGVYSLTDLEMHTFAPLFNTVVDSSLWLEPDYVVKIFLTMLAKKDHDHVVRGTAFNISVWAKKTEQEVLDALKILSSPDTKRIEKQAFEGRRVERVEDGWLVLNGAVYRELMVQSNERARKRRWAAEKRAQVRQEKQAAQYADKHGAL